MSNLTFEEIEYLQYCVKTTAFNDGSSRRPRVEVLKNKLVKMRAALEKRKILTPDATN
tara:strand:+ start:2390 stop:2563 length:174 start_codon:yes stop_codon:yes gene_type:complete